MSRLDDLLRETADRLGRDVDRTGVTDEVRRRARHSVRGRGPSAILVLVIALTLAGGIAALARLVPLGSQHAVSGHSPSKGATSAATLPPGVFAVTASGLDQNHQSGAYTVSAEGQGLVAVVPGAGPSVSWSPDGTMLAFTRGISESQGELAVANADGTGYRVVTSFGDPQFVSWSPQGDKIAFTVGFDPAGTSGDIYVIGVDGSGLTRLTDSGGACSDLHPAWSPDASLLTFNRDCGGDGPSSIHVVNADGSGDRKLVDLQRTDQGLSWSPDGAQIAFAASVDGNGGIFTVSASGGPATQVTKEVTDESPAWVTATQLAFVRNGGISVIDLSDGQVFNIVSNPGLRMLSLSWVPK